MDILTFAFMQRAFLAGGIVALICPIVGIFMVIRQQSLMSDGLGHIAFAGVTGASLLHIYPPLGAAILTVGASLGIEYIKQYKNHHVDMIMALFFYTGLALAVIFATLTNMPSAGLLNFLFGSILTVTNQDILLFSAVAALVLGLIYWQFSKLLLTSFDADIAEVCGVNCNLMNMLFAVLIALVVVVGMSIVGILLISALMIIPVASAFLWGRGFKVTMTLGIIYSFLAVFGGLVFSFYQNFAPGGTIVMLSVLFYILTFIGGRVLGSRY